MRKRGRVGLSLYFRMPRVASHSIMRLVRNRSAILPHALSPELVRHSLLQNETAFRWTFVRNPYTRFVSAYNWTQREPDPARWPFDSYEMDAVRGMSMDQVARILPKLCANGPAIHFYPQTSYLYENGRVLMDWIGRFEELDRDFDYIAREIGVVYRLLFGRNVKAEDGPVTDANLSEETTGLVADFYAEDFARLGYS